MPKGKPFNALKRVSQGKIPYGMFSTLEDLIDAAPQERMTAKQWREYLQPGRILEREGVKFPLKKEEIDYTIGDWLGGIDERSQDAIIEKSNLIDLVKRQRPDIRQGPNPQKSNFSEHSTQGPRRYGYFESLTGSPDFGEFRTHYDKDTLSWHRGSRHALGADPLTGAHMFNSDGSRTPGTGVLRMIDEIQSDRHSAAAEKIPNKEFDRLTQQAGSQLFRDNEAAEQSIGQLQGMPSSVRRGYRTPEDSEQMLRLREWIEDNPDRDSPDVFDIRSELGELKARPPDAPFKNPADYGRLELKRGILEAIREGDQYVGVTPSEGPINWFDMVPPGLEVDEDITPQIGGMQYSYDKVYPGELRKLAQQYGAPFNDLEVPVTNRGAGTARAIIESDSEDLPDYLSMVRDFDDEPTHQVLLLQDLLKDYAEVMPDHRGLPLVREEIDKLSKGQGDFDHIERILYGMDNDFARMSPRTEATRKVPSMELTPEVIEKIKKAGIPLWAVTSGVIGLDALTGENTEGPAFARGGAVRGYSVGGAIDPGSMGEDEVPEDLRMHSRDVLAALSPKRSAGLELARKAAELPGTEDGIERRKQLLVGMLTQLYGLDTKGDPSFLGYDDARPNKDILGTSPLGGLLSKLRPGALDETMALPTYFNFIPGVDKLDNPVSQNSADRQMYLEEQLRHQLGIEDSPDEWDEDLAYNLGIMLGQIPVAPMSAGKTAATKVAPGVLKALGRGVKKIGSAGLEFFSPVINPKASNYAAGTAFGTALSTGGRKLEEAFGEEAEEFAQGGEVGRAKMDPRSALQYTSGNAAPTNPGQAAQNNRYVGQPLSYEEAMTYGQGPERKFFDTSSTPLDVDFSKTDPVGGPAASGDSGSGNGSKVAGVLGSIPAAWKGLGMLDGLLGTGIQEGLKGVGKGILSSLGIGGGGAGATGALSGTGLGGLTIAPNAVTTLPASLGGTGAAASGAAAPGLGATAASVAIPAAIAFAGYKSLEGLAKSFKKDPAALLAEYDKDSGSLNLGLGNENRWGGLYDKYGFKDEDVYKRLAPALDYYYRTGDDSNLMSQLDLGGAQGIKENTSLKNIAKGTTIDYGQFDGMTPQQVMDSYIYTILNEKHGLSKGAGDVLGAIRDYKKYNPDAASPFASYLEG